MKLVVVGYGDVGKSALAAVFRIFPKNEEIEIILLGRDKDKANAVLLDVEFEKDETLFLSKTKSYSSKIKSKASSDIEDLKDADVVIFTIGISAVSLGSSNRDFALPFVYSMVIDYGRCIKEYAPNSFILMVSNPSDITTWIIQEVTGFPQERVLGFGCDLDSRRFCKAFRKELEKININVSDIAADVIGGHSEYGMIIPRNSIFINQISFNDFKKQFSNQIDQIDQAFNIADKQMRSEGFQIVRSKMKAAEFPVLSVARAARSILFGVDLSGNKDNPSMTCSVVLKADKSYYGICDSCISVPIIFGEKYVKIDSARYELFEDEQEKLEIIAQRHKSLFYDIKNMPSELIQIVTKELQNLREKSYAADARSKIFSEATAKIEKQITDTNKIIAFPFCIKQPALGYGQFSQITLELKDEYKTCSEKDKLFLFDSMHHCLSANVKNCLPRKSDNFLILEKTKEVINFLESIGLVEKKENIQSRL